MIAFSHFLNTVSRDPTMITDDWSSFVEFMADYAGQTRPATEHEKKYVCPLVSPAVYAEGATRLNANVQGFGGWYALDVDDGRVSVDQAIQIMEAIPSDYVIWTTTKSKVTAERYRIAFPLDRFVSVDEMRTFWHGAHAFFGGISDKQTKDPARIFNVPATWEGSDARFHARSKGDVISVDELLSYAPPPPPPPVPVKITTTALQKLQLAMKGAGATVDGCDDIMASKVVNPKFVEDYLSLPKGEHYVGLYTFMCRIASRALNLGYSLTVADLVRYARQMDDLSMVKTAKQRWSRISTEAAEALAWASRNHTATEYSIASSSDVYKALNTRKKYVRR